MKRVGSGLRSCLPQYRFFSKDGQEWHSLPELASAIPKMDRQSFRHHVNEDRNDFATWTKDVFGDKRLAREISRLKNPHLMSKRIKRWFR